MLNKEKFKVFPLRLETKEGCPLFPLLFNTAFEVLAKAVKQKKDTKWLQIGKKLKYPYLYII